MTAGAYALLALVFGIIAYDFVTLSGKNRRALWLEAFVFLAGGLFIVFPDLATSLAHRFGIGRGVDFLMYPLVIWLVRESLMRRRLRLADDERMTAIVRALAIADAKTQDHSTRG